MLSILFFILFSSRANSIQFRSSPPHPRVVHRLASLESSFASHLRLTDFELVLAEKNMQDDLSESNPIVPHDGMKISTSCTFVRGTYSFPNGVSIVADNVTVDLGGSVLSGTNFTNAGLTVISQKLVTVKNGFFLGYYYGVKVEHSQHVWIESLDSSRNWADPHAHDKNPPWLDINVVPGSYGDRTNLGGGLFMNDVVDYTIQDSVFQHQENGMDLFSCNFGTIVQNDASFNVGWGIHLYRSSNNMISDNVANNCVRVGPNKYYTCDTSGLLLNCRSSNNVVRKNYFLNGGDGVFVSGFPRKAENECCPSIGNVFVQNDCSGSPNNAFEDTFSTGNLFSDNIANNSDYGFWLGYSHGVVLHNNVIGSSERSGIAIEHGQKNEIRSNLFDKNNVGVQLWTDLQIHFPASQYACLDLPDAAHSALYNITDNWFTNNGAFGLQLTNTTDSIVWNNYFEGKPGTTAADQQFGKRNKFFVEMQHAPNIVGGPYIAGNFWSDYTGKDLNHDGIGDTELPYLAEKNLKWPGDDKPLVLDANSGAEHYP